MKYLFIVTFLCFLGCSTAQMQKDEAALQGVQNATTKPVVVGVAAGLDTVTGGTTSIILSAAGTLAALGVIVLKAFQTHATTTKLVDSVVAGANAAAGVLTPSTTTTVTTGTSASTSAAPSGLSKPPVV